MYITYTKLKISFCPRIFNLAERIEPKNKDDRKIGFHVSIAGSISNAVPNALKIGCTAFQIFSRNPRGWNAKVLDSEEIEKFKKKLSESNIDKSAVATHMPYLPNLSAPPGESYEKSKRILLEEIIRCSELNIPNLVIHLGSHLGEGKENGKKQLTNSCNFAIDSYKSSHKKKFPVIILLENSSGQKNSIGNNFEEIREILDVLNSRNFGVCLDTCHAFTSGYDLRDENQVENTLNNFEEIIGFSELKIIHLNDSKGEFNSNKDRHEHIGLGCIGKKGLSYFLKHREIAKLPTIMGTPIDKIRGEKENMDAVYELIK